MRKLLSMVGLALLMSVAPVQANEAYVVSRPQELQLVNLEEGYNFVSEGYKKRFDLLGSIRRMACRRIVKAWGLKETPDKSPLQMGVVANTDNGPLQFVCVVKGESLDGDLLLSRMVEKYGNHLKRHDKEPNVAKTTIGGNEATVLPLIDREGEFVVTQCDGHFLFASVLPGQYEIIENTASALKGERQAPQEVNISYKGRLTDEERRRIATFFNRTLGSKVKKFRASLSKLLGKLTGKGSDEAEMKTTNEKVNELFLKLVDWSVDFHYEKGAEVDEDMYRVDYKLQLPSNEEAQKMKELLLEKILFYKTNAKHEATVLTMDTLSLDVSGNFVQVSAEVDTREGIHSLSYAYLSFMLGYSKADTYLLKN